MDLCATGDTPEICWFCRKGRHDDCMKNIPTQGKSDGPHDCTFDTKLIPCKCQHQEKEVITNTALVKKLYAV